MPRLFSGFVADFRRSGNPAPASAGDFFAMVRISPFPSACGCALIENQVGRSPTGAKSERVMVR